MASTDKQQTLHISSCYHQGIMGNTCLHTTLFYTRLQAYFFAQRSTHMNAETHSPLPYSTSLEDIVSLCKRRGFIYPTADVYGGLNGLYDKGPLGVLLIENIKRAWRLSMNAFPGTVVYFDGSILAPEAVWNASGHTKNFHDPLVDCKECQHRFRADDIDLEKNCTHCGKKNWSEVREFHMMFSTNVGASVAASSKAYLRPETAQSIFSQFRNIMSTNRVSIPFGVGQIGKAFRNEITPKQFLFRTREFEQMELEWFCAPDQSDTFFSTWQEYRWNFYKGLGFNMDLVRLRSHEKSELSHYSKATTDVEFLFPFGWKELEGIAHRGAYDLTCHQSESGKDFSVLDQKTNERYIPHVVECSVGVERLFLATLCNAYAVEEIEGEKRTVLRFPAHIAPYTAALFPLVEKLSHLLMSLKEEFEQLQWVTDFDAKGSIGKRYRRHDEIGTPFCITADFDTETDSCVTIRHRDTMQQDRIPLTQVTQYILKHIKQGSRK